MTFARLASLLLLLAVAPSPCSAGFLSYSFSATNNLGTPQQFSFDISVPITPISSPITVSSSLSLTLADPGGDGVSITPLGSPFLQTSLLNGVVDAGVDVGPAISRGPVSGGATYALGPFTAGPIAGPAGGPYTSLAIHLAFTLSGGDSATFSGLFTATQAVPEPASLALALVGGSVLTLAARRKRRTR